MPPGADQPDPRHIETPERPDALQERHIALPVATEMEVVANNQRPGVQAVDEDFVDEGFCRFGRTFCIEVHDQDDVDPRGFQERQLLVEVSQQQRG